MAKRDDYEAMAEKLIMPIIESNGYELVDIEYVKEGQNNYLRAYIDKPGGITVDDCEVVSRAFSDKLDEKDFIAESYILEVELKLYKPVEHKKDYVGLLNAYDKDTVTIGLEDGSEKVFERRDLAVIRQTVYF